MASPTLRSAVIVCCLLVPVIRCQGCIVSEISRVSVFGNLTLFDIRIEYVIALMLLYITLLITYMLLFANRNTPSVNIEIRDGANTGTQEITVSNSNIAKSEEKITRHRDVMNTPVNNEQVILGLMSQHDISTNEDAKDAVDTKEGGAKTQPETGEQPRAPNDVTFMQFVGSNIKEKGAELFQYANEKMEQKKKEVGAKYMGIPVEGNSLPAGNASESSQSSSTSHQGGAGANVSVLSATKSLPAPEKQLQSASITNSFVDASKSNISSTQSSIMKNSSVINARPKKSAPRVGITTKKPTISERLFGAVSSVKRTIFGGSKTSIAKSAESRSLVSTSSIISKKSNADRSGLKM